MMRFLPAPAFLLALLFLPAIPAHNPAANPNGEGFLYDIAVDRDGDARVEISFQDSAEPGSDAAWLAVPGKRFTNWTYSSSGDARFNRTSIDFFYDNLSFTYSHDITVTVRYNFSRASMIVEPDAFFMSPRILFSPEERGEARVSLSRVDPPIKPTDVSPRPSKTTADQDQVKMTFSLPILGERITVYYLVTGQVQLQSITVGKYAGLTPTRYAEIMDGILQLYSRNELKLEDIFHTKIGNVTVRFFSPKPDQMDIEGYTPFNATQMGDIFMNLFYTRFIPGHFEQASLHELVHHYLWASGINPQSLWMHEGGANFFSTHLTAGEGYIGAEIFRDSIIEIGESLEGDYGIVEDWRPGPAFLDLTDHYAASYMVFETLNKTYGFDIFSRFFSQFSQAAEGSVESKEAIRFLSIAAEENLNPLFGSMGFRDLPDLSDLALTRTATRTERTNDGASSMERSQYAVLLGALALLVFIVTVIVLASKRTRRDREPLAWGSSTQPDGTNEK